ncbi:MAG: hypothetical protein WDN24_06210 [Sphingomonas sp.]
MVYSGKDIWKRNQSLDPDKAPAPLRESHNFHRGRAREHPPPRCAAIR